MKRKKASKVEIFVDSLMPIALVMLVVITIIEFSLPQIAERYYIVIDILEVGTIAVFAGDLYYKFMHAKSIPNFLVHNWFYILAVFPFFLIFRLAEKVVGIEMSNTQMSLWLRSFIGALQESRIARFSETFRFLGISSRMLRAVYFFENPSIRHRINVKKLLNSRRHYKNPK